MRLFLTTDEDDIGKNATITPDLWLSYHDFLGVIGFLKSR